MVCSPCAVASRFRVSGLGFGVYGLEFGVQNLAYRVPEQGVHGHQARKVDERLPGKWNSNSHGARLVHLILTMMKWIRTSRLSIKNSFSLGTSTRLFLFS